MALFSQAKERSRAREEAAQQGLFGATALEAVDTARAQTQAGEQARAELFGALGSHGSYDLPGAASSGTGADFSGVYDTTQGHSEAAKAQMKYGHLTGAAGLEMMQGTRKGILDPKKYAEEMKKTAGFRIQSRLTADAESLLAKKGDAWEALDQATRGQITEGAATQLRENIRDIRNRLGKGGSARNEAMADAQQMLARERANQMRVSETWNANLKLDQYVRENAMRVQNENVKFMDNLPLIRQSYNETMNSLAEMMAHVAVPVAAQASQNAFAARNSVKESKIGEKLILGAISGVLSMVGGSGIGGVLASAGQGAVSAVGQNYGMGGGSPAAQQQSGTDWGQIGGSIIGGITNWNKASGPQAADSSWQSRPSTYTKEDY